MNKLELTDKVNFICKNLSITDDPNFGCTVEFSDTRHKDRPEFSSWFNNR